MTTEVETVNYAVGHNMPGYLPEADVYVYADWDSAKRALIDEMLLDADYTDDADEAEELTNTAEDLNLDNGPEWSTVIGNTSWWIMLTDETPEDDS